MKIMCAKYSAEGVMAAMDMLVKIDLKNVLKAQKMTTPLCPMTREIS